MAAKNKKVTSKLPPGIPEQAVGQEVLMRFFRPPIGKTTFFRTGEEGSDRKAEGGGWLLPSQ